MKFLHKVLILLNITALILIFIHIFIHPTFSSSFSDQKPSSSSVPPSIQQTNEQSNQPKIIILSKNCSECDCNETSSSPELPFDYDNLLQSPSSSTSDITQQEELVEKFFNKHLQNTKLRFQQHPSHSLQKNISLEEYMSFLAKRKQCQLKPIFLTMARVSSELYWQLIENYFYTMDHFGHLECTVMVCVSDSACVKKCKEADFPCFNYIYENPDAPTFEQVAAIKLKHTALALDKGVNIMLLDLDVGFLRDPMILYEGFLEHDNIQVRAQMDIGWGMDKSQGMTWTTFPRANFGLFLVKGTSLSAKLFHRAWDKYVEMPQSNKKVVAKDQSIMQGSLSYGRWRYGYNFSYFYPGFLPQTYPREVIYKPTLLLHKVEDHSIHGVRFELGGVAAQEELGASVAVHATCYEKTSKLHVLKTSNAFWGDKYYNPSKKTIIKPLMLSTTPEDLLNEIKTLAFIAMVTNRSLILPNILIGVGLDLPGQKRSRYPQFDYRINAKNALPPDRYPRKGPPNTRPMTHCPQYGENLYWPGFRTIYSTLPQFEILEPGFYSKIEEQLHLTVPEPHILSWKMKTNSNSWTPIYELIQIIQQISHPRLVLDLFSSTNLPKNGYGRPWDLINWAKHSVSSWGGPTIRTNGYQPINGLPSEYLTQPIEGKGHSQWKIHKRYHQIISNQISLCHQFLIAPNGNRSCFNKCN